MKEQIGKLIDILRDQINLLTSLHSVLIKEKEAVVNSDLEVLNETGKEKENLFLMIRLLEEQRLKIMNQLSVFLDYSSNNLTLNELCRIIDEPLSSQLKNRRSSLLSLTRNIREINQLNKKLLSHSLGFVKGSLNIIDSIITQNPVYHKTGELQPFGHSGKVLSDEI